jgi:hypothetical protein
MNDETARSPGFWSILWLLLRTSRKRAAGRSKRQQELFNSRRRGVNATDWTALGFLLTILFMAFLNGCAAWIIRLAVESGERIELERQGKTVVSERFFEAVRTAEAGSSEPYRPDEITFGPDYSSEAKNIAEREGGKPAAIEKKLRESVLLHATGDLIARGDATSGLRRARKSRSPVCDAGVGVSDVVGRDAYFPGRGSGT